MILCEGPQGEGKMSLGMNHLSDLKESDKNKFTNKYLNLLKISELNCKIPALVYMCDDEFDYFCKEGHLSVNTRNKIENFTQSIQNSGDIPLFSIRCEGKGERLKHERLPHTILNLGLNSMDLSKLSLKSRKIYERLSDVFFEIYYDRAGYYKDFVEIKQKFLSVSEEIEYWLGIFYQEMKKIKVDLSYGVIIQQMVFGNVDDISGMGICCNWVGEQSEEKRFKGVFLRKQQGILTIPGCWGKNECDLDEFRRINPKAYDEVYRIFCECEKKCGENPYLEFEVVCEDVYILQYEQRQRNVEPS